MECAHYSPTAGLDPVVDLQVNCGRFAAAGLPVWRVGEVIEGEGVQVVA